MNPCQLPPPLQPGDRLIVIAPSGTLRHREVAAFEQGLALWRSQGYQVDLHPHYREQWGYLAGRDSDRVQQWLDAYGDSRYRGILCVRGGYGSMRLVELLRQRGWQPSQKMIPKWVIGFSDVTALLWSLWQQGRGGIHGPVLTTLAAEPAWSRDRLWHWLCNPTHLAPLQGNGWGGGAVTGYLLPGNLTVATHLLHTPLLPDLSQVILAIEDVGEAPYRLDRLLTQWRLSGCLQQVKGIALGRFSQCEAPPEIPSLAVATVLRDRLGDLGKPIVADLPFGHDGPNAALPVGIPATLNGDTGTLTFMDPANGEVGSQSQL
ncbi:S66 peptidase family protein [Trichothermofontia sp.]